MRNFAIGALFFVTACSAAKRDAPSSHALLAAGDYERALTHDGATRTYRLHVPPQVAAKKPLPVVIGFHGGGGNAEQFEKQTKLRAKADDAGFVLIEPNGTGSLPGVLVWNAGNCCNRAVAKQVDDVGFVRAILDVIVKDASIDPKRVFATGFSNGAIFAHRLACELSDRIAAIAPVSGGLGDEDLDAKRSTFACAPSRPVPVYEIHGLEDAAYPFGGGFQTCSKVDKVAFRGIEDTFAVWGAKNGCAKTSRVTFTNGQATCRTLDACKGDAETTLCTLSHGKHDWPAGVASGGPCSGPTNHDLVANDAIWTFFAAHPMR